MSTQDPLLVAPPEAEPLPHTVAAVLLMHRSAVLAGLHSPELFETFLQTDFEGDSRALRALSTAVMQELQRVGGPLISHEGTPMGPLQFYREALMGSQTCLFTNSKGGLINGSVLLLETFFARYPTVLGVYESFLLGEGGEGDTECRQCLAKVSAQWSALHPNDDEYPAHPSESLAPPMVNDEDKLHCLLVVNLTRTAPEEEWAPLLALRDTVVASLTDFLTAAEGDEHLAGKVQAFVWRLQNELSVLNPSLTPAQLWQTVHRRVAVCITAAKGYLEDVEKERSKRYSNSGVWGRLVGAVRSRAGSRAGNAAKSVSDSAFDRLSECHTQQGTLLVSILEAALQDIVALRPASDPVVDL